MPALDASCIAMPPQASEILNGRKPAVIVFDCDWTLYPYDCDKDRGAPFTRNLSGVNDFWGRWSDPYPDVPHILGAILDAEIPVAFLSRNPSADAVENLLRTIPLYSKKRGTLSLWAAMPNRTYFHAYSAGGVGKGKDRHFAELRMITGIPFNQMLFFDDMKDNIEAAAAQGTTGVLLGRPGLTWAAFTAGITGWRERLEKIEAAKAPAEQHPPTAQNGAAERGPQEEGRQGEGEARAQPLQPEACAADGGGGGRSSGEASCSKA